MSHTARQAREIAHQWVTQEAAQLPGFAGAFFHGSIHSLPDEAILPATSDVDMMVIFSDHQPQTKPGKFIYQGLILEVSDLSTEALQSPEAILSNYQLATSFRFPGIIMDPTGLLTKLQDIVGQNFAKRHWVYQRCEDARRKVERDLQVSHVSKSLPEQVMGWLFGTGKLPHILLVAGLVNPTVRKRYVAVRDLLDAYGYLDFHQRLLSPLGCVSLSRSQAEQHLAALTAVFDATCAVIKSPFFFASDLSLLARPLAIDGSRELIEAGLHQEAIFWIAVTYSRCQLVLAQDAPQMEAQFLPGYHNLLRDLGADDTAALQQHHEETRHLLPETWAIAEAILAANPAIEPS